MLGLDITSAPLIEAVGLDKAPGAFKTKQYQHLNKLPHQCFRLKGQSVDALKNNLSMQEMVDATKKVLSALHDHF